jgi:hypothetical protein
MAYYDNGGGTQDLATRLGISTSENLSMNSVGNSRIIRTTLRDSYQTLNPTLYIIGITFLTRHEIPILSGRDNKDGKWLTVNSKFAKSLNVKSPMSKKINVLDQNFTDQDIADYCTLYDKFTVLGIEDLALNLQYQLLSLRDSLCHRGHRCLIFNTSEHALDWVIDKQEFDLLKLDKHFIEGLKWKSIPWQFEQGADFYPGDEIYPAISRHVALGQHQWLNEFLVDYINQHGILE